MSAIQPLIGIIALLALAWAISVNRRAFPWRVVAVGIALQFALALMLLKAPGSQLAFAWIGDGVNALMSATEAGTSFVFGFLGGAPLPFDETSPGGSVVFAFRILPLVILISALSAVLYHYKVLPWIVFGFAWVLGKTLRISGASSFATAANVFIGMVESPLLVRPYLARMTRSELFMMMTAGMATIAGTVFAVYANFLSGIISDPAGHLLTASIISAPAAVVIALIMMPPDGTEERHDRVEFPELYEGGFDALTRGTIDGLRLLAYIVGMVLVMVALVALVNIIIAAPWSVDWLNLPGDPLTLEKTLGWIMAPVAWTLGVPWSEAVNAGQLLGTKIVINEFVAYIQMSALPAGSLSERSGVIMAYAICGFGNLGSVGIMVGGIGAIVPERRVEIAALGLKSIIAGSMATCMTGAVAGLLTW